MTCDGGVVIMVICDIFAGTVGVGGGWQEGVSVVEGEGAVPGRQGRRGWPLSI